MKLIKLGAAYINMDLVTDVWVDDDQVTVFLAVPVMYTPIPFHGTTTATTTREIRFMGVEAAALLAWLENQASVEDITPDGYEGHLTVVRHPQPSMGGVQDYEATDDSPS